MAEYESVCMDIPEEYLVSQPQKSRACESPAPKCNANFCVLRIVSLWMVIDSLVEVL